MATLAFENLHLHRSLDIGKVGFIFPSATKPFGDFGRQANVVVEQLRYQNDLPGAKTPLPDLVTQLAVVDFIGQPVELFSAGRFRLLCSYLENKLVFGLSLIARKVSVLVNWLTVRATLSELA